MAREPLPAKRGIEAPKDYAVRVRCPHGGEDVWVDLEKSTESVEQIFRTAFDFECPLHGVQRELPIEVQDKAQNKAQNKARSARAARPLSSRWKTQKGRERSGERLPLRVPVLLYGWVRSRGAFHEETQTQLVNPSGALVVLRTPVELGETFFLVNKATQQEQECRVAYVTPGSGGTARAGIAFREPLAGFWKTQRLKPRVTRTVKVWVRGRDRHGHPFSQSAYTINISQNGARLDGTGIITGPGDIIEVRRGWHKARFRVVWTGLIGTPEANHVGICCLEADKNIWGLPSEEDGARAAGFAPR